VAITFTTNFFGNNKSGDARHRRDIATTHLYYKFSTDTRIQQK